MRINIFKEDGKGDGKGESCGIRRFAGALTGRGSRSIIMHVYIFGRHPGSHARKNTSVETMER